MNPPIRNCAIYTRKSTEEGLEQDFNTLDAQREACLAYIASQKSEGWVAARDIYNDGGFSGGNIDRPALQQLLNDIKAKKIHIVVVYKIDRLTRSLMDFSKLVEIFDQHQVTFVSVTQSFNTTTSMGRLTLNVLLSFAQFEREVIGERTRDKIAASKRKGMWMGGVPPFGYDIRNRQLIINPIEAVSVKGIFEGYLEARCVRKLQRSLESTGIRSKQWTSKKGRVHESVVFTRGALYFLLANPIYAGMVRHRKTHYPGLHEPIIPTEKWEQVQQMLAGHAAAPRGSRQSSQKSLLKGKLFDVEGKPYGPVYTSKRGKKYRYYLNPQINESQHHLKKEIARFPAHEIEKLVEQTLKVEFADKHKLALLLQVDLEEHYELLNQSSLNFAVNGNDELIIQAVQSIVIDIGQITIEVSVDNLKSWIAEKFKISLPCVQTGAMFKLHVPFRTRRANKGSWVIQPENQKGSFLDLPPQELANLVRGIIWRDEYFTGTPVATIAEREGLDQSHVHRLIRRSLEIS